MLPEALGEDPARLPSPCRLRHLAALPVSAPWSHGVSPTSASSLSASLSGGHWPLIQGLPQEPWAITPETLTLTPCKAPSK